MQRRRASKLGLVLLLQTSWCQVFLPASENWCSASVEQRLRQKLIGLLFTRSGRGPGRHRCSRARGGGGGGGSGSGRVVTAVGVAAVDVRTQRAIQPGTLHYSPAIERCLCGKTRNMPLPLRVGASETETWMLLLEVTLSCHVMTMMVKPAMDVLLLLFRCRCRCCCCCQWISSRSGARADPSCAQAHLSRFAGRPVHMPVHTYAHSDRRLRTHIYSYILKCVRCVNCGYTVVGLRGLQKQHPWSGKGRFKMFNQETRSTRKMNCQNSENNTVITSDQQLAFGKRAKEACPTSEQKERVQIAPLCRQESKRNVSTGTLVWATAIWFLGLSAPLPVATWLLGFLGYSL